MSALVRAVLVAAGAASFVSACASRPVTDGVTGVNSYNIAQSVRCELRDYLIALIAAGIARDPDHKDIAGRFDRRVLSKQDPEEEHKLFERFLALSPESFGDTDFADTVSLYRKTVVAYTFEFNIDRTDNIEGGVDVLSAISHGTVKTGLGASFNGIRATKREFTLVDTFEELLVNRPTIRECNQLRNAAGDQRLPNGAYPIAGKLNIAEIVETFVNLNQSGNLAGKTLVDGKINPTLSETMTFTTTISAGLKPTLTLEPLGRGTKVTGANLDLSAKRVDRHILTLAINLPTQKSTTARKRSEKEQGIYSQQERAAIVDLERQRLKELEDQDTELRRRLLLDF